MTIKKNKYVPKPDLDIWIQEGKLFRANIEKLKAAVANSKNCEKAIKYRMGYGYKHLIDALEGKYLDIWAVRHVEGGITHEVDNPRINKKFVLSNNSNS